MSPVALVRVLRAAVFAVLCVLVVPAGAGAGAGAGVVDRSEFSTTTRSAGGVMRTKVSPEPLNYRDALGSWRAVDTDLRSAGGGKLEPGSVDGDVVVPSAISDPIKLSHDGRDVSVRLIGASGGRDAVKDSAAEFDDVLSGVDAQYRVTPRGVKETLVLASSLAARVFRYDVRGPAGWAAGVDARGDVVLKDTGGTVRYRISAPIAWDSAADPAYTNDLELSVQQTGDGRWTVTLTPDQAWLTDPARRFPVSIDPDFSWADGTTHFHGAQDCYLAGYTQANYSFCATAYLATGFYNRPYRSLLRFDIASAIPSDATVTAATFKAFSPPATPKATAGHSLHTVTSDWDDTATWNHRKTGVAWTSSGGDYSTDPALTSTSTPVAANPSWYTWDAPVAAVQGWVDGTLPNYGFLLSTDNYSGCCSYVWASTEADPNSQFPATTNEWPTLDVTWTPASGGADTTPPSAPTDLVLLPLDAADGTAGFNFTNGIDSGANASGFDHNEFRFRRGGETSYSAWGVLDGTDGQIDGLTDGQNVEIEVRTVDGADNLSATTSGTFVAATGSNADAFDVAAQAWLSEAYGMNATTAQDWVEAQARADGLVSDIQASTADQSYAGVWFENETRKVHVRLLDAADTATVQALASDHDLTAYLAIDITAVTEDDLSGASDYAQNQLQTVVDDGWVDISYSTSEGQVTFEVATDAPQSARDEIGGVAANLGVPTDVIDAAGPRTPFTEQKCGPTETDPSRWNIDDKEHGRSVGCGPPFRGGVQIDGHDASRCTSGFNVRSIADDKPYVMTAGHCYEDSDMGKSFYALNSQSLTDPIGPLHNRALDTAWWTGGRVWNGDDAAIVSVTNPKLLNLRPWIVTQAVTSPTTMGQMQPRFEIDEAGRSSTGQTICISGAQSGTHCGTVTKLGLSHNKAAQVRMCTAPLPGRGRTMGGDSGGPFFRKNDTGGGVALGMLSGIPGSDPCIAQYASVRSAIDRMRVWLVTTATTDPAGDFVRCPEYEYRNWDGRCIYTK